MEYHRIQYTTWKRLNTKFEIYFLLVCRSNRHIRGLIVILLTLIISFPLLLSLSILSGTDERLNVVCVNKEILSVDSPSSADGLVMDVNIPVGSWKHFTNSSHITKTNRRIFFHETSGRGELSVKQCCVVESAARNNPDRIVQLFLSPSPPSDCSNNSKSSPLFYRPPWLQVLSELPNVESVLVDEAHYFAGTPLDVWYNRGEWRNSKYKTAHLADYMRIVTLYKGGGLYLDLDIFVLKSLNGTRLRNCLVYEDTLKNVIGNSVMDMDRGFWLATEIMKLISSDYDPEGYSYHGPAAVGEVIRRYCGVDKKNKCADINLLPNRYFYPIPSFISQLLFRENNATDLETLAKIKDSFGLHLWNSLSNIHQPINLQSKNQVFAVLARQHCPSTVAKAADFK